MEGNKPWYTSKGVWGGLIALVAAIAGVFGYNLGPELQGDIVNWAVGAAGVVGGALGLYGRVKATKKVGG